MTFYCNYCKRESEVERLLGQLRHELGLFTRVVGQDHRLLHTKLETIMSALDDLKAAITELVAEAVTDLEAVIAKLAQTPPDQTADIAALTAQAKATTDTLKKDMAAIGQPAPVTPAS